jgi:hypothetical protein
MNNYDAISHQILEKKRLETIVVEKRHSLNSSLWSTREIPKVNQLINNNFQSNEEKCKQLEKKLSDVTSEVNNNIYTYNNINNNVVIQNNYLKETLSKNEELDLKITASKKELSDLKQEIQVTSDAKSDIFDKMSDKQKFFVLKKAQDNLNQEIIDLVINSGFDEQAYINLQNVNNEIEISGQFDEVEDVFN